MTKHLNKAVVIIVIEGFFNGVEDQPVPAHRYIAFLSNTFNGCAAMIFITIFIIRISMGRSHMDTTSLFHIP